MFIEYIGWHWLIKLYRFQVYSSIMHHLYNVLCVHHPRSSLIPSPFTPPFTLFYLPPPPFSLVITKQLSVSVSVSLVFFFQSLHFFHLPPLPFPSDSCQSVLCVCVSILFVFKCSFFWIFQC